VTFFWASVYSAEKDRYSQLKDLLQVKPLTLQNVPEASGDLGVASLVKLFASSPTRKHH
jgi:hypothetical protein